MSIKKLFDKIAVEKSLARKSEAEVANQVESVRYHDADIIKEKRFIPPVDFAKAENFARYGSAKQYYRDAITNIYKTYPYDGSLYERLDWENSSSYVDLYIFNERYPRTNGYIKFSYGGWGTQDSISSDGYGLPETADLEYITLYGGPHTGSTSPQIKGSNIWSPVNNRESNLEIDLISGSTVEFWMKKEAFDASATDREVVFDLWNYESATSAQYGRLRVELDRSGDGSSPFLVTVLSGATDASEWGNKTVGFQTASIGSSVTVTDNAWHHYALTFKSASMGVTTKLYIDGGLNDEKVFDASGSSANARSVPALRGVNKISGSMMAYIGALRASPSGSSAAQYAGKLSASLDEFRYWKTDRTGEDISRYWFTPVGGGTNTDLANVDLGVYYKFNEGITGTSVDSTILDFSGRVTNGGWIGYADGARSTNSAIVEASASATEFKDPIVYSFHPDVANLQRTLENSGSYYDVNNNSSLYHLFPSWMQEADEGESGLLRLTQIIGNYFDTVHLQIEHLNTIQDNAYVSGSNKPNIFAERLLASRGLLAPELFLDADVLEKLADRSENKLFIKPLVDIKNTIYQNIYNNLIQIYKSKGTAKSFRNLIRCFGVDEELINLNLYGNNIEYEIRNNTTLTETRKRLIDFNHTDRFNSSIFQNSASANANSVSYISGSTKLASGSAYTLETEILFPKKLSEGKPIAATQHFPTISSSLFGAHTVAVANETFDIPRWDPHDAANFQVYAVRDELGSPNARFVLTSSTGGYIPEISSPTFNQVYDNSKWTLAVRVKPFKYPLATKVSGSAELSGTLPPNYSVELYGVETQAGIVLNEFLATSSVAMSRTDDYVSEGFLTGSKRIYVGAHAQDFTSSVITKSDVKIAACRYWVDYIDSETLKAHNRDVENYGPRNPYQNAYLYENNFNFFSVPQIETLALNWDFEQVTGSDSSGNFLVADFSSGSLANEQQEMRGSTSLTGSYDWLGPITQMQHPGRGYNFPASTTKVVDVDYLVSARQNLPENLYADDMISVLNMQDDVEFTRESRPITFFFAFEKSMYRTISEEMIKMFGTITEFNNLIGEPANKYRPDYKRMKKLRHLFYQRVENTPDLDKYIEFYKWFDTSLSRMLQQLIPASADFAEDIRVMVENPVLSRDKYQHKFPTLEQKAPSVIGTIKTILSTTGHGWKFTHAPVGGEENINAPWWSEYAQRNVGVLSSSNTNVNTDRSVILSSISGSRERRAATPYRFKGIYSEKNQLHGGINFSRGYDRDYVYRATAPVGPLILGSNIPSNIMISLAESAYRTFIDPETGEKDVVERDVMFERFPNILDEYAPNIKRKIIYAIDAAINKTGSLTEFELMRGRHVAPFNLFSSSLSGGGGSGYHREVNTRLSGGVELTNLHTDTYGPSYEVPMQGPFTEKFVGGRQHRHIEINQASASLWSIGEADASSPKNALDTAEDRGEGFKILLGMCADEQLPSSGALGIVGPQYPDQNSPAVTPPYLFDRPKAHLLRDGGAKRPVNIKNIKMTTGSLKERMSGTLAHSRIGNYQKNYQIVQTAGRSINDPFFQDQSFDFALYPETLATRGRFVAEAPEVHSLLFDGSNDHVTIGTGANWDAIVGGDGTAARAFSISMWAYPITQVDTYPLFIVFGNNRRRLQTWGSAWPDQIRFSITGGGGTQYAYSATNAIVADTWQHVIITYSGGTSGDMKIYIDGALSGTPATASDPHDIPSGEACMIGSDYAGTGANWAGNMCDVAVWTKELSATEATEIYNSGRRWNLKSSTCSNNLLAWYKMGDDPRDSYNGTIYDQMAFVNGTPTNFPDTAIQKVSPPFVGGLTQNLSGNLSYAIPARTGSDSNQSIIVNRFSAPGGYVVSSQGYMDPAHEELSVYNALPYRNLSVLGSGSGISASVHVVDQLGENRGLQTLSTLHCAQFGADPSYGAGWSSSTGIAPFGNAYVAGTVGALGAGQPEALKPSYHKINRNTRRRVKLSSSADLTLSIATASCYNNAYVTTMIPASDRQYAWITASFVASGTVSQVEGNAGGNADFKRDILGYIPRDGMETVYEQYPLPRSVEFESTDTPIDIGNGATDGTPWNDKIGGAGADAKAFSISVWFLAGNDLYSAIGRLIAFASTDRALWWQSNRKIRFYIGGATAGTEDSKALNVNQWYHLVATYSGGTAGTLTVYIDGSATSTYSQTPSVPVAITGLNCLIGDTVTGGGSQTWDGNICDVAVWGEELSATQAALLYNGGHRASPLQMVTDAKPISWWPLGGNPRDSVVDGQVVPGGTATLYDEMGFQNATMTGTPPDIVSASPSPVTTTKTVRKEWTHYGYPLLTASELGAKSTNSLVRTQLNNPLTTYTNSMIFGAVKDQAVSPAGFLTSNPWFPVDFVTNTLIYDPIATGSLNVLGYPLPPDDDAVCITEYINSGSVDDPTGFVKSFRGQLTSSRWPDGTIGMSLPCNSGLITTTLPYYGFSGIFNSLILHRDGPYGWPTFKQIRNCGPAQHPIVRYWRKNNYITLRDPIPSSIFSYWGQIGSVEGGSVEGDDPYMPMPLNLDNGDTITSYIEPAVMHSQNETAIHTIIATASVPNADGSLSDQRQQLFYNYSFGANVGYFSNTELNNRLGLTNNTNRGNLYFNRLNNLLLKANSGNGSSPFSDNGMGLENMYFNYRQAVYPAAYNRTLTRTRTRPNYNIGNIWNNQFKGDYQGTFNFGTRVDYMVGGRYTYLGQKYAFSGTLASVDHGDNKVSGSSMWPLDPLDYSFGVSAPGEVAKPAFRLDPKINNAHSQSGELQNLFRYSNIIFGIAPTASLEYTRQVPYAFGDSGSNGASQWGTGNQPQGNKLIAYGGAAVWQATGSAKVPFTNYEEYCENLRLVGKEYSIIPEFRISEHMNFYVNDCAEDYWRENPALFDLTGASIPDSSTPAFYKEYTNSDFMKLFEVVDTAYDEQQAVNDKIIRKDKISLRCKALLKFLPYKGFYPAERTIELGKLYSASYAPSVTYFSGNKSGPPINSAFRAFTDPLFGPGILYNTIKSGVAVGNYVYCNVSGGRPALEFDYYGIYGVGQAYGAPGLGGNYSYRGLSWIMPSWGGSKEFAARSLGYWPLVAGSGSQPASEPAGEKGSVNNVFGGLLPLSSSTQASGSGGYFLHKVPFEALLKPADYLASASLPNGRIWDSGLVSSSIYQYQRLSGRYSDVSASANFSGSSVGVDDWAGAWAMWDGQGQKLYEYAIDNFVCETVNFFQEDLKSFSSAREDQFLEMTKDQYYSMRVTMQRPRRKLDIILGAGVTAEAPPPTFDHADLEIFDMYSRPSGFGDAGACWAPNYTGKYTLPITTYMHVVPSYYYGESSVTIIYKAQYNGKPALDDILAHSVYEYDRTPEGTQEFGYNPYGTDDFSYTQVMLRENRVLQAFGASYDQTGRYNIKDSVQMISSSINLKQKIVEVPPGTDSNVDKWLIQTKFETPVLNFAHISINDIEQRPSSSYYNGNTLSSTGDSNGLNGANGSTDGGITSVPVGPYWHGGTGTPVNNSMGPFSRGMWHQYGKIPEGNAGIFMSIDTPEKLDSENYGEIKPKSLAEVVGFEQGVRRQLGTLKTSRVISEAVVAIPYRLGVDGRKKLFGVGWRQVRGAVRQLDGLQTQTIVDPSVRSLVRAMRKYVFPPTMDFLLSGQGGLSNDPSDPYAAFVFEFSQTLSRQDLADIWQNLPPGFAGEDFQAQTSTVRHQLLASAFFNSGSKKIDKELRWMVFKVKERAASNYNKFIKRNLTDDLSLVPNSIRTPYTYNWPYDYFSLVELVKVGVGIQYSTATLDALAMDPSSVEGAEGGAGDGDGDSGGWQGPGTGTGGGPGGGPSGGPGGEEL